MNNVEMISGSTKSCTPVFIEIIGDLCGVKT